MNTRPTLFQGTVHKVRHVIFGQFLPPLSLCHTLSHIPGPQKVRHTSQIPPTFSRPSTKNPDKSPLFKFSFNCSRGLLSGGSLPGFCPGWCLSILPSVRIHLLQQKVKNHFKFHVSYV